MRSKALFIVFGAFALSFSAPTFAKKGGDDAAQEEKSYPVIEATGIAEFDPTFMRAKAIHDTLDTTKARLVSSNKSLAAALALPETTSLDQALSELKTKANGKIKVAMNGKTPKLTPSEAVPPEIQTAIDAVNKMVDDMSAALGQLEQLPGEATAVVAACKDFPSQLGPDLLAKNNLKATDILKVTKLVKADMSAVTATPQRLADVTGQILGLFSKVQSVFAG